MTEPRIEVKLTFKEFIATRSQGLPFSREDILGMAIDQVNDGKPLTIITKKNIFIISPESIAEFLAPPKPEEPVEPPAAAPAEAPALPGESEAKPVV